MNILEFISKVTLLVIPAKARIHLRNQFPVFNETLDARLRTSGMTNKILCVFTYDPISNSEVRYLHVT